MLDRYTNMMMFETFIEAYKSKDYVYGDFVSEDYKKMLVSNIKYCLQQQCEIIKITEDQTNLDKEKQNLSYMKKEIAKIKT